MKKLRYRMLAVILSAAFFSALLLVMRTGSGAVKLVGAKFSASLNRGNISIAEVAAEKMAVPPLPNGRSEFTCEDLDHIFINGEQYDFPLRYNELPEEFSLSLYSAKKDEAAEKEGIERYFFFFDLYYNDLFWAFGGYYSDKNEYDPNNVVIETLMFAGVQKNKYLPQVIIGGLDAYDTDPAAVDRVYGIGAEDYYLPAYYAEAADMEHEYVLRVFDDKVSVFQYHDAGKNKGNQYVTLTKDEYCLPEDYSPEADEVNNSMEYVPVPEDNDKLQLALENLTVYGNKVKLPCTVNSLLYTLRDTGAYIEDMDHSADYYSDYDLFKCAGKINTDDGIFYIEFLFAPGQGIGDARVIGISSSGKSANHIEISGIDNGDPSESDERYGMTYSEEDEKYRLTDYEYNNVVIWYNGDMNIYYWGENLTAVGEDTSIY